MFQTCCSRELDVAVTYSIEEQPLLYLASFSPRWLFSQEREWAAVQSALGLLELDGEHEPELRPARSEGSGTATQHRHPA